MVDDDHAEAHGAAEDEAAQDIDEGDAARQLETSVLPSASSSAPASVEPRVEGDRGSFSVFRGDVMLGSFWYPRAVHTQAALYM